MKSDTQPYRFHDVHQYMVSMQVLKVQQLCPAPLRPAFSTEQTGLSTKEYVLFSPTCFMHACLSVWLYCTIMQPCMYVDILRVCFECLNTGCKKSLWSKDYGFYSQLVSYMHVYQYRNLLFHVEIFSSVAKLPKLHHQNLNSTKNSKTCKIAKNFTLLCSLHLMLSITFCLHVSIQRNTLTSLIHFVQLYSKED